MAGAWKRRAGAGAIACLIPAIVAALPARAFAQQPTPVPPPPYGPPPTTPAPAPAPSPAVAPPVSDRDTGRGERTIGQHLMFWTGVLIATVGFSAMMASFYYMEIAEDNSDEIEMRYGPYGESDRWDAEAQALEDEGQRAEIRFRYMMIGGGVLCIVGSLFITSGAVRPKKKPALSIAPTNGGAIVGWTGGF